METETVAPTVAIIANENQKRKQQAEQIDRQVLHYQNAFEIRGLFILGKEKCSGSKKTADRRFRSTFGT